MKLTAPSSKSPEVQAALSLRYKAGPLFFVCHNGTDYLFTNNGLYRLEPTTDIRELLIAHFRGCPEAKPKPKPLVDLSDIDLGI